jgi:AbrB family looped-hinge helix DNA binding protein
MQTRVSTKGQIVLPGPIRRRLGIRAGDPLDAEIEAGSIILTPLKKRLHKGRINADPVTGLPVLSAGADAPVLSSKEVEEIIANFP